MTFLKESSKNIKKNLKVLCLCKKEISGIFEPSDLSKSSTKTKEKDLDTL